MIARCKIKILESDLITRWANAMSGFYGHPIYLVGSQLTKTNPRDVDIVCVIPDEEFKLRYIQIYHKEHHDIEIQQWYSRYMCGLYNESNWLWWRDCHAKSIQGMRNTRQMIDFKVWAESTDKGNFYHKPKLRLDEKSKLFYER